MSVSIVQVESTNRDLNLEFNSKLRPTSLGIDSNIDDPVNDTGLGPRRGDLQMSNEFACLLNVICANNGEF
jgi:hypothetical protein